MKPVVSKVDLALGVLNGAVGQYLARSGNGLAIEMGLYRDGAEIALERAALASRYPDARRKVVVLVHGLMATEASWLFPDGGDYGSMMERDHGVSALYVRYNSGVAIVDNGVALAGLLEQLIERWPVAIEELILLGHSMGGLVARAAVHTAGESRHGWPAFVRRAFYVGTPHLGSPVERLGRTVTRILLAIPDPYTQLVGQIADLRSDGIKDLGDHRNPVPLSPRIAHYLVAATVLDDPRLGMLFGDLLVPVRSATAGQIDRAAAMRLPPEHIAILPGVSHNALAHHPSVYERLHAWLRA